MEAAVLSIEYIVRLVACCHPTVMVAALSIAPLEKAVGFCLKSEMKFRSGGYHEDIDSALPRWNNIWLRPLFCDIVS